MSNQAKQVVVLWLAGLLGACSLLPAPEPVQSWVPTAATVETTLPLQLSGLRVQRPQTSDLLGGSHMLVLPPDGAISVYRDARWGSAIPSLWRDYLVDALQRDSRFARVSSDAVQVSADYELVSRLNAFQSEYREGQPVAVMRAYLQLVDTRSRDIIAERALALSQPASGPQLAAVVDAFSNLMAKASEEVAQWLLESTVARQ